MRCQAAHALVTQIAQDQDCPIVTLSDADAELANSVQDTIQKSLGLQPPVGFHTRLKSFIPELCSIDAECVRHAVAEYHQHVAGIELHHSFLESSLLERTQNE